MRTETGGSRFFNPTTTIKESNGTKLCPMKKGIICLLALLAWSICELTAAPQAQEADRKTQRSERREERRQRREERRQERQERRQARQDRQQQEAETTTGDVEVLFEPTDSRPEFSGEEPTAAAADETTARQEESGHWVEASGSARATTPAPSASAADKRSEPQAIEPDSAAGKPDTDDSPTAFWIILLFIAAGAYSIVSSLRSRRCKHCGRNRAMQVIDERYLGRTKSEWVQNGSQRELIHHNRIQVTRRCKYCGYEDVTTKIVKGDQQ